LDDRSTIVHVREEGSIHFHHRGIAMQHMDLNFVVQSYIRRCIALLAYQRYEGKFDIDLHWVVDIRYKNPVGSHILDGLVDTPVAEEADSSEIHCLVEEDRNSDCRTF